MDPGSAISQLTEPSDWPGDRNPDQWDVHDAYQTPEVSIKHRFKAALLLSDDGIGCFPYMSQVSAHGLNDAAKQTSLSVRWILAT